MYTIRRDNTEKIEATTKWIPNRKRLRSRPKKRFIDKVKEDMVQLDITN